MRVCPSCGGIVGRDCFNPVECAQITESLAQQHDQNHYAEGHKQGYVEGYHQATIDLPPSQESEDVEAGWTDKKPVFTKECLVIAAIKYSDYWEYSLYEIKRVQCEDGSGWYLGLLKDGEEWGDLDDFRGDKYLVINPIYSKQPNK